MTDLLITENFGSTWLQVEPRLLADLCDRGVRRENARDVCQEVALKALSLGVPFESESDLLRWARVVGRRLAIDHHRRDQRLLFGDVPDRSGGHQPEEIVTDRLEVASVAAALAQLPHRDRELLLSEPQSIDDRREQVRIAVRRHRARQRVLALIAKVAGWLGGMPILRRLLRREVLAIAVAVPLVATAVLLPRAMHGGEGLRRMPTQQSQPDQRRNQTARTTAVERTAESKTPPTTTTKPRSRSREPLRPLHGTQIDYPEPAGGGYTRIRESTPEDHVLCGYDYPILGDFCTPL